jgi:predicted nucleic acid-binding protein
MAPLSLVIDASVVLAWALEDESSPYADAVQEAIVMGETALAPAHWQIEVANGLLVAERRERITRGDVDAFLEALESVPIQTEVPHLGVVRGPVLRVARRCRLATYDAAYLALASHRGVALASADRLLVAAARRSGIALWAPPPSG